MSGITSHVLDTSRGRPAADLKIELHRQSGKDWKFVGSGLTDPNGRCNALMADAPFAAGTYRLTFHAGAYYKTLQIETIYTEIPVIFEVRDANGHYHVPLLISPYGYSTYRGS
jgi:5-hydroxyisourate hydrolase